MLFRPKERAWDREECLSEERQDERGPRGRKEEDSGYRTEKGGHGDGTILFPCIGLALSSGLGMREPAPSSSLSG